MHMLEWSYPRFRIFPVQNPDLKPPLRSCTLGGGYATSETPAVFGFFLSGLSGIVKAMSVTGALPFPSGMDAPTREHCGTPSNLP